MSAEPISMPDVVHDYQHLVQQDGLSDLFVGADGPREHQDGLADVVTEIGGPGLRQRHRQAARLVADDGITYGSGEGGRQGRNWVVDPLPVVIDAQEWAGVERGLQQRGRVLDLLLGDLYGERRSVREGIIPGEVLAGHPGFLRPVDGIRLPGAHQLIHLATDLGRASTGEWVVYGDRADAPSGAGYAMATRRIATNVMARLHRETPIARLRAFFHTMSASLLDAAPLTASDPRVVLLSPGPESETAYDQAFLATLLGLPLVESVDLSMREGVLYRTTTSGEEVVDVVLRRVDADWCDPLDLRGASRLGVPGMVEAARRGVLSVINPLGSGVLENPGLMRVMPELTRYFLGEDELLPSVTTWWCGVDAEREHVLANLEDLVVKPLSRTMRTGSLFVNELSSAEREQLAARITAEPWKWCAQERVDFSTAPVIRGEHLEPRGLVLRTFAVAQADGYQVMPGALGRVAASRTQQVVSNATGALAKDIWVLVDESTAATEPARLRSGGSTRHEIGLSTRSAGNLFWLGRYAERTEASARLLRVAADLTEDHSRRPGSQGFTAMGEVLAGVNRVLTLQPGFVRDDQGGYSEVHHQLRSALFDARTPGTVAFAADRLVTASQAVRELLSLDTWLVLARLERILADEVSSESQLRPVLAQLQETLLAFAGIMAQSMIRDASWAYIDLGCRIERAQLTVSLVRTTMLDQRSPNIDAMVTEAVLTAGESIITHRRRLASGTGPQHVVDSVFDLLWLDASNPRSVAYQLDRMIEDFEMVDAAHMAGRCRSLRERLLALDPVGLASHDRSVVRALADEFTTQLRDIASEFEQERLVQKVHLHNQPGDWGTQQDFPDALPTSTDATTDAGSVEGEEQR